MSYDQLLDLAFGCILLDLYSAQVDLRAHILILEDVVHAVRADPDAVVALLESVALGELEDCLDLIHALSIR